MNSKLVLCGLAGVLSLGLFPCASQAQGRRSGIVQSPFGPLYDTRSPEWRMAGGDMMMYQQIMEQKMMLRQQQMFMKQQQMLMRQQKSGKTGTQPGAGLNAAQATGFGNSLQQSGTAPTYRRKSRLRGTTAAGTLKSAAKRGSATTSATTKKPGTASPATTEGADASPTSGAQTPEP
jgi:hypothetical protein